MRGVSSQLSPGALLEWQVRSPVREAEGVAWVTEKYLPNMHEALGLVTSAASDKIINLTRSIKN